MTLVGVSERLRSHCERTADGSAWLAQLPGVVQELLERWKLSFLDSLGSNATCSWVALVRQSNGVDAVLKVPLPHFEALDEIASLRFLSGDPSVRLLEADEEIGAMLLERCAPGTPLSSLPEAAQDAVIAGLLKRFWRSPPPEFRFRSLADLLQHWFNSPDPQSSRIDPGLVRGAQAVAGELLRSAPSQTLLATDLHAGNVLRAQREPWLVIDPKPFVGDPAYDATQHVLNRLCKSPADPRRMIDDFAARLEVSAERVARWTFIRASIHADGAFGDLSALARLLAP